MRLGMCMLLTGWLMAGSVWSSSASAMMVTGPESASGVLHGEGIDQRMLDRLMSQESRLLPGQYQPIASLVPVIDKRGQTYSLFTSGLNGAPAPSATITGSSIVLDLSSLFFGVSRGNSYRPWNIGGLATGLFNPDTREFSVSWESALDSGKPDRRMTLVLHGTIDAGPQPVAIPPSLALYATGLIGLGSWAWRRARSVPTMAT